MMLLLLASEASAYTPSVKRCKQHERMSRDARVTDAVNGGRVELGRLEIDATTSTIRLSMITRSRREAELAEKCKSCVDGDAIACAMYRRVSQQASLADEAREGQAAANSAVDDTPPAAGEEKTETRTEPLIDLEGNWTVTFEHQDGAWCSAGGKSTFRRNWQFGQFDPAKYGWSGHHQVPDGARIPVQAYRGTGSSATISVEDVVQMLGVVSRESGEMFQGSLEIYTPVSKCWELVSVHGERTTQK